MQLFQFVTIYSCAIIKHFFYFFLFLSYKETAVDPVLSEVQWQKIGYRDMPGTSLCVLLKMLCRMSVMCL